jgi:hypothetical protein
MLSTGLPQSAQHHAVFAQTEILTLVSGTAQLIEATTAAQRETAVAQREAATAQREMVAKLLSVPHSTHKESDDLEKSRSTEALQKEANKLEPYGIELLTKDGELACESPRHYAVAARRALQLPSGQVSMLGTDPEVARVIRETNERKRRGVSEALMLTG